MILIRVLAILRVLIRHRLDRNLPDAARSLWLKPILFLVKLSPTPDYGEAEAARRALEELGPIFIKFGQMLSTRRDLFSPEMSKELQKLQDQVPPFDSETARAVIEQSIGAPIEDVFESFEVLPMASASVAQVHAAELMTDAGTEEVVVKVIRPGIEVEVRRDIRLMYFAARTLQRFWTDAQRLHPVEIVRDYERTILGELNLELEAINQRQLRDNWHGSGKLYVPRLVDPLCSETVMVMERIYGVTATDIDALTEHNVDMKKLAHLGVEIFFSQVFEDNFFHADMHPGNVFVDVSDPGNPTYIALDCAIIGSLTENDKDYLAKNLLAFFHRDYEEVARLHVKSGWVPPDTDIDEFGAVIRRVCDPFFAKPIKDISFGTVLLQLFQTARQFNMEVQPQLVLLQKTLINIEGMGRQIYPDLDLWETAAPFMEGWMTERMGLSGLLKRLGRNAPRWIEQLPEIPDLAYSAMVELRDMGERNRQQSRVLTEVQQSLEQQTRRSRYQRLGGLALIAALFAMLTPASASAAIDPAVPGSVLGALGVYWLYIHT